MSKKVRFEQEFILNASRSVLFPRLATPSGLSDWFADDVNIKGSQFNFFWDGSEQVAEMIAKRTNHFIRFRWMDEEDEEAYFEFRLESDDLTNEVALVIIDHAEEDEMDDAKELWETQIDKLKRNLGL